MERCMEPPTRTKSQSRAQSLFEDFNTAFEEFEEALQSRQASHANEATRTRESCLTLVREKILVFEYSSVIEITHIECLISLSVSSVHFIQAGLQTIGQAVDFINSEEREEITMFAVEAKFTKLFNGEYVSTEHVKRLFQFSVEKSYSNGVTLSRSTVFEYKRVITYFGEEDTNKTFKKIQPPQKIDYPRSSATSSDRKPYSASTDSKTASDCSIGMPGTWKVVSPDGKEHLFKKLVFTDKLVLEMLSYIKENQKQMKEKMETMLALQQIQIEKLTSKAEKFDELVDVVQNLSHLVKRSLEFSNGCKLQGQPTNYNRFSVPQQTSTIVLKSNTIEDLLSNLKLVSQKLDDLQPKLNFIEKVHHQIQNGAESDEESNFEDEFDDEINETLDALLTGPFSFARNEAYAFKGKVMTRACEIRPLNDFIRVVMKTPWIAFPLSYEMECCYCYKTEKIDWILRDDKVSIHCSWCSRNTIIGAPKSGFQWVHFSPCDHYQEIKIGEQPQTCSFCEAAANFIGADHTTRTPRRTI